MTTILKTILGFACLLSTFTPVAQVSDIGKVQSWRRINCGIEGATKSAYFRIQAYNDNIIRVRVSQQRTWNDFSYLLAENIFPGEDNLQVQMLGKSIFLRTTSIDMEVEKEPSFRVVFRNKEGIVINEDVPGKGFGTAFIGQRSTLYKCLQPGERFVGLGEVLGNLDKRGTAFSLNNTDTYRYGDPRLPMYANVPFYIGIHHQNVYGLFYHNTFSTYFNFGISTPGFSSITAEGGDVDYFFICDNAIADILNHYTYLTGRMPLPPIWSLGYHQSRCSYFPQKNVLTLAKTFREKEIPIDCIVLDADYLQDYEPFRINTFRFPDMPALTRQLAAMGIEVTASVNPGIKLDTTYFAYKDGLDKDIFVKYADNSLYTAEIAPSLNHFIDFTNPKGREWWSDHMKFLPDNGIHGYWNDMNEPAVGGSYLPDNLLFDFEGYRANALEAKNLYGMLMARSSYESALKYGEGRRPFILTRSGFAGVQRYAAVWTGDNTAKDEYLPGGALLNTQMGLSGIPFVGDDIGGYIGNTSKELFIRWMEVGMFAPFARNHKEAFAKANEPWSFGEEAEAISKEFIGFRYRLLPYLYSTFYEASATGLPVARSLCINDPFDEKVYDISYQYQFLCGDAILVTPITSQETTKTIYLPEGQWYDLYSDISHQGRQELEVRCPLHRIPLFVKESAVIPMQNLILSTKENHNDTLYLHLYNGEKPNSFVFYEDDGLSMDYQSGEFRKRRIAFDPVNHQLILAPVEGKFESTFHFLKFIFHGFPEGIINVTVNGQPSQCAREKSKMIDGLRFLEDIYDKSYLKSLRQQEIVPVTSTFTYPNESDEIRIQWQKEIWK